MSVKMPWDGRFGIPYQGSKNLIAEDIIGILPDGKRFVDLFAGGCAMTHAAMVSGKYGIFLANDLNGMGMDLFFGAIEGSAFDFRWVDRDVFHKMKDSVPFVRYCWSYGNNGNEYCYNEEIEPFRKAIHKALVEDDYSYLKEFGIDDLRFDGKTEPERRLDMKGKLRERHIDIYRHWYLTHECGLDGDEANEVIAHRGWEKKRNRNKLQSYLRDALKKSGKSAADVDRLLGTQMSYHYFGNTQWQFPTAEAYEKLKEMLPLPLKYHECAEYWRSLNNIRTFRQMIVLEELEQLGCLNKLKMLDVGGRTKITKKDYAHYKHRDGDVVYCDPPYAGTGSYNDHEFDSKRFWTWVGKQSYPVFVSEYAAPRGFTAIWRRSKQRKMCSVSRCTFAEEMVFVADKYADEYKTDLFVGMK